MVVFSISVNIFCSSFVAFYTVWSTSPSPSVITYCMDNVHVTSFFFLMINYFLLLSFSGQVVLDFSFYHKIKVFHFFIFMFLYNPFPVHLLTCKFVSYFPRQMVRTLSHKRGMRFYSISSTVLAEISHRPFGNLELIRRHYFLK